MEGENIIETYFLANLCNFAKEI